MPEPSSLRKTFRLKLEDHCCPESRKTALAPGGRTNPGRFFRLRGAPHKPDRASVRPSTVAAPSSVFVDWCRPVEIRLAGVPASNGPTRARLPSQKTCTTPRRCRVRADAPPVRYVREACALHVHPVARRVAVLFGLGSFRRRPNRWQELSLGLRKRKTGRVASSRFHRQIACG